MCHHSGKIIKLVSPCQIFQIGICRIGGIKFDCVHTETLNQSGIYSRKLGLKEQKNNNFVESNIFECRKEKQAQTS